MAIHAPMQVGLPPGAVAHIMSDYTVDCEACGARVSADKAVQAMGGKDFCSDDCLWDWTADHRQEVIEWLKD